MPGIDFHRVIDLAGDEFTVYTQAEVDAAIAAIPGGVTPNLAAVLAVGAAAGTKITTLTDPASAQDAATKAYVDAHTAVPNLAAVIAAGAAANAKITSLTDPTLAQDAATKAYVDAHTPATPNLAAVIAAGGAANAKITALTDPTLAQDAATKAYVDAHAGGGGPYLDSLALAATYGDEFDGNALNARWTVHGGLLAHEPDFAVAGTWMQMTGGLTASRSIFQTGPSKDILEVVVAFSQWAGDAMTGPAIVDASGTGVLVCARVAGFYLSNATAYAYASDGISSAANGQILIGPKVWMSLRKFKTALDGDVYFGRVSMDGAVWGRGFSYKPSAFTYAKIGWGALWASGADANDVFSIDRFNVLNALNLGANLCITPSSGTVTPTASSNFGGLGPARAIDGTANDWAAATGNADAPLYFQVAWSVGQTLNRVLIKERSGDNFGAGHIEFSDGATTTYVHIPTKMTGNGSTWHIVEFPTLTGITTMKIVSDEGGTANGGFIEVEAYLAS